jgi:hypothetical protein
MVESMSAKTVLGILVACVSGFLGGALASQGGKAAPPPDVVRASRFELVNRAGRMVASWEVTPANQVRLQFGSGRAGALEIGSLEDGRPFLRMRGRDGKNRLVMELDTLDKPMIGMGDEKWEGRVHLGFVEPDVLDPASDDWRLSFSPFGTTRPIASMGMFKAGAGQEEGRLTISGRRIQ